MGLGDSEALSPGAHAEIIPQASEVMTASRIGFMGDKKSGPRNLTVTSDGILTQQSFSIKKF
jgi:hypothetical protein